jgi:2'-5' RNA ligase
MNMRLFIAINFGEETRSRLLALRDELQSKSKRGRYSLPENFHLTLAFLGECDAKQTAAVKAAMDTIAFEPLSVSIERIGRFRRDGGDIWWAGVKPDKPLINLHGSLTDRLIDTGFVLEKRKYSPHITLGREVETDAEPWQIPPFGENICCMELMKSERAGGKLTYTPIHEVKP